MMSMRHAAIALLVLLLLIVLGRKRLRHLISRRLRLHMLMTDAGRSVPSELLVSTLSWRYDSDADESENDPYSPRLLSSANARSRRRWGQQPSPPKPVLRRRDSAPMGKQSFVGTWQIKTQDGRDAILQAMELPYLLRKSEGRGNSNARARLPRVSLTSSVSG